MTSAPRRTGRVVARWLGLVLVVIVTGLGVAACGDESSGDSDTTTETTETTTTTTTEETTTTTEETTTGEDETTTDEEETTAARALFVANCGSCHTLADAGTEGTVGPNLDAAEYDRGDVEDQIRNGGGGMPAFEGELTDEQIDQLAAYVSR